MEIIIFILNMVISGIGGSHGALYENILNVLKALINHGNQIYVVYKQEC